MRLDEDWGQNKYDTRLVKQARQIVEGLECQAGHNKLFSNDNEVDFMVPLPLKETTHCPSLLLPNVTDPKPSLWQD